MVVSHRGHSSTSTYLKYGLLFMRADTVQCRSTVLFVFVADCQQHVEYYVGYVELDQVVLLQPRLLSPTGQFRAVPGSSVSSAVQEFQTLELKSNQHYLLLSWRCPRINSVGLFFILGSRSGLFAWSAIQWRTVSTGSSTQLASLPLPVYLNP